MFFVYIWRKDIAQERANAFDFWDPRTLVGPELKPGDKAPAFTLTKLKNEKISSYTPASPGALAYAGLAHELEARYAH